VIAEKAVARTKALREKRMVTPWGDGTVAWRMLAVNDFGRCGFEMIVSIGVAGNGSAGAVYRRRMPRPWTRSLAAAAIALLAGCGPAPIAAADGPSARDAATSVDLAPDDGGCAALDPGAPDGGVCLRAVTGRVVDEAGAPLASTLLSVCAEDCFFGQSGPDGRFSVAVGALLPAARYALELHGRPDRASYYLRLPALEFGQANFATALPLPRLPSSGPSLPASVAVSDSPMKLASGALALTIAPGTTVEISVEDAGGGAAGRALRVLALDPATGPGAPPAGAFALYACSPFEAIFSQPIALSFANATALPAGAAVDVLAMRGLLGATPPAGGWDRIASAHVATDGRTIDTDAGQGPTILTWLALRKAP